jgi:hypothetical protein
LLDFKFVEVAEEGVMFRDDLLGGAGVAIFLRKFDEKGEVFPPLTQGLERPDFVPDLRDAFDVAVGRFFGVPKSREGHPGFQFGEFGFEFRQVKDTSPLP